MRFDRKGSSAASLLAPLFLFLLLASSVGCSSSDDDDDGPSGGGGIPAGQDGFAAMMDEAQEVPAPISGTRVRVTVTNAAPQLGTFQTPVWVGFHDGTFDLHDLGLAADAELESLAEDGDATPIIQAFAASAGAAAQAVLGGVLVPGPLRPGETIAHVFELDGTDPNSRYLSYASMVIPSNDAFVANDDPTAHEIFDAGGNFVAADFVVAGSEVLDAGTEVNDEVPANTAFFGQTTPGTGVSEGGVVALHPGFLAMGMGGILDDPMFAEADFTAGGYEALAVQFEELPPAPSAQGVAAVQLSSGGNQVAFSISATGLSGPATGVHFHTGALGVAGPVVISLTESIVENSGGDLLVQGSRSTTLAFVNALRAGGVYVNVHTALNPDGELRGQVLAEEAFFGPLTAAQEVPTPTLGTGVRVTVRNAAPALGTFQTPVWIGFHDGTFDTHDLGSPASTYFPSTDALEHLAEDGDSAPITDAFDASLAGAVRGLLEGGLFPGPLQPGETTSRIFRLDPLDPGSRYLSYASMVIPSNDAFVSNDDPLQHEVFDAGGTFTGSGFTVAGSEALDAGTEVNDEVPANTAFFGQTTPDTGTDEGGNVALHAGFLAPGMGGILDDPMFAAADFTVPGYELLEMELSEVVPVPATGIVATTLDDSETQLEFSISVQDLSGPATGMHFHEGAPGIAGPVLIDLIASIDVNEDGVLFATGSVPVDAAFVDALRAGNVYVNVHTDLNPTGELRGQLVSVEE